MMLVGNENPRVAIRGRRSTSVALAHPLDLYRSRLSGNGTYPGQKNAGFPLENGQTSGIWFQRVDDRRFRSAMILPDKDVGLKITVPNYDTASASLNLKESETKELSVTLKAAIK